MWKNTIQPDRPQMTTWCMSIAGWIPKVTYTHPNYVYLLLFPLQQWLHKRTTMSLYMYIACLVSYKYRELNRLNLFIQFLIDDFVSQHHGGVCQISQISKLYAYIHTQMEYNILRGAKVIQYLGIFLGNY